MSKPEYADEIIAKSAVLREIITSKKSIADKLKILYPNTALNDFNTYAKLIENIPYNIDYVFEQVGLTCQEEFIKLIDNTYTTYIDENIVYSESKFKNSNIIYAPTRSVAMNASYCFYNSNLIYCEPLIIPAGANISNMFNSKLEHLELTVDNSKPLIGSEFVKSSSLKEFKINGIFRCFNNNYGSCFNCENLEYADMTIDVDWYAKDYWMLNSVINNKNTIPITGLKFHGTQKGTILKKTEDTYDARTTFLPYTTADIIIDYVTNHIVDFTQSANQKYLSYYSTSASLNTNRATNIFILSKKNIAVLQDAGKYSEFEDLLNARGWVSLKQYQEGNILSKV